MGPHRVYPGRLSVSRAFGNAEAKLPEFGGLPNVIISVPDITCFKITKDCDFLVIACDGVFDMMTNEEVIKCAWMSRDDSIKVNNIHIQSGIAVDIILKTSLLRKTLDNVTCILVAFPNFESLFDEHEVVNTVLTNYENLVTVTSINNDENFSPIKIKNALSGKMISKLDSEIGINKVSKDNKKGNELKFNKQYNNANKIPNKQSYPSNNIRKLNSTNNQNSQYTPIGNKRSNSLVTTTDFKIIYNNTVSNMTSVTNTTNTTNNAAKLRTNSARKIDSNKKNSSRKINDKNNIDSTYRMFKKIINSPTGVYSPVCNKTSSNFNNIDNKITGMTLTSTQSSRKVTTSKDKMQSKPNSAVPHHKKINSMNVNNVNIQTEIDQLFNKIGISNKPVKQLSFNKTLSKANNKIYNPVQLNDLRNARQNILENLYLKRGNSSNKKSNMSIGRNNNQTTGNKKLNTEAELNDNKKTGNLNIHTNINPTIEDINPTIDDFNPTDENILKDINEYNENENINDIILTEDLNVLNTSINNK